MDNGLIGRYEERILGALIDRAVGAGEAELALVLPFCDLADLLPGESGGWRAIVAVPVWAQMTLPSGASAAASKCAADLVVGGRHVQTVELIPGHQAQEWRRLAAVRAREVVRNQAAIVGPGCYAALGMRFRSKSEVIFARELDRRGIPFMALPLYRWQGTVREPDFVVLVEGGMYVVEIHGAPYHPPGRTAIDFQRDLVYRLAGMEVVTLDAGQVYRDCAAAVELLLRLAALRRAA